MVAREVASLMDYFWRRVRTACCGAAAVALMLALAGCGGSSAGNKLYVVGLGTPNVEIFDVSSAGALTADTTNLIGTGSRPDAIMLTRKYAYVLDSAGGTQPGTITEYKFNGTGTLSLERTSDVLSTTSLPSTPPKTGLNPTAMAMDSNNKFMFTANQGSNNISVFAVDSGTGLLTEVTGSPFATAAGPSGIVVVGSVVFVANSGAGVISGYMFDNTTGNLTQVTGSPFAAGTSPAALDADAGGKYLFAADSAANNVLAFSITGTSGQLSPISGSPFAAGTTPVAVKVAGNAVYVANYGSGNISAYSIGGSGALAAVSGSPFTVGTNPAHIASDHSSGLLFVANQGADNLSVYKVGGDGGLSAVSGSPFATAVASPAGMATNF